MIDNSRTEETYSPFGSANTDFALFRQASLNDENVSGLNSPVFEQPEQQNTPTDETEKTGSDNSHVDLSTIIKDPEEDFGNIIYPNFPQYNNDAAQVETDFIETLPTNEDFASAKDSEPANEIQFSESKVEEPNIVFSSEPISEDIDLDLDLDKSIMVLEEENKAMDQRSEELARRLEDIKNGNITLLGSISEQTKAIEALGVTVKKLAYEKKLGDLKEKQQIVFAKESEVKTATEEQQSLLMQKVANDEVMIRLENAIQKMQKESVYSPEQGRQKTYQDAA